MRMRLFSDCDSLSHFFKAAQPRRPLPFFVPHEGFRSVMFGLIDAVIADIFYSKGGQKCDIW